MSRKQGGLPRADDTNPDDLTVHIPGFDPPTRSRKQARTEVPSMPPEQNLSPYDPLMTARGLGHGASSVAMWPIMFGLITVLTGGIILRLLLARLLVGAGLSSRAAEPIASLVAVIIGVSTAFMLWNAVLGRGDARARRVVEDDEDRTTSETVYAVTLPWDASAAAGPDVMVGGTAIPIPAALEVVITGGEPGATLYYLDDRGDDLAEEHFSSVRRAMGAAKAQFGIRHDEWETI